MKYVPDDMMDGYLNSISGSSDLVAVCAGSPTTYSDCTDPVTTGGSNLALIGITSGCFSLGAGTPSGRELTISAKTGASIVYSGSALAVALLDTSTQGVAYITTCTEQYLVGGGTVDIPSWTITITDPS